jgi:ribonuclease HII
LIIRPFFVAARRFSGDVKIMEPGPDYSFERVAILRGLSRVAGVDEVGRGPLCGPVVAAAVVLDAENIPDGLDDSKKLSPARRETLFHEVMASAEVAVGMAAVDEIDTLNILRASHLAMTRAIAGLGQTPNHILIDGHMIPQGLTISSEALVKGDGRSQSIAAASIVAKVTRDLIMVDLAQHYPGYGWDKNAGYPTKLHLAALQNLGVTPHHRRSFKPVHNILYQAKFINP